MTLNLTHTHARRANLLQALRKDNKVRLVDKRKWYILDK